LSASSGINNNGDKELCSLILEGKEFSIQSIKAKID